MSSSNYFPDSGSSPRPRTYTSGIVTDFKAEKLIPLIRILRTLPACNSRQQRKVMKQIPNIFHSHGATSLLTESILKTLCHKQTKQRLPAALYEDIVSVLPSDDQLNLKDSVYESKLVATPENPDQNTNNKKSKRIQFETKSLPMTLLRIPSDLQFHLFHYLDYLDLVRTQQVCRSLCIAARNPLSLYSLTINPIFGGYIPVSNECFSQPTVLTLDTHHRLVKDKNRPHHGLRAITGNTKWSHYVTELILTNFDFYPGHSSVPNLPRFDQLEKITISNSEQFQLNVHVYIPSYDTLKELSIKRVKVTEQIIDQIRKFRNLEKFSTDNWKSTGELDWGFSPISIPKLKEFSFQLNRVRLHPVLNRILIGSHPEIVNIDSGYVYHSDWTCPNVGNSLLEGVVAVIQSIKQFNVVDENIIFLERVLTKLQKVKVARTKLFEKSLLSIFSIDHIIDVNANLMPRIIDFFQFSRQSALELDLRQMDFPVVDVDKMVADICDDPYRTFDEITVNMDINLWSFREKDGEGSNYITAVLDAIYRHRDEFEFNRGRAAVQSILMEFSDEAEKRMKFWLLFDKKRMKQIGLRKLNIKLEISTVGEGERIWNTVEQQVKNRMTVEESMKRDMVLKPNLIQEYKSHPEISTNREDMIFLINEKKKEDTVAALRTIVETMISEWMKQRADRWKEFENRCIVNVDHQYQSYTICLFLRSDNVDSDEILAGATDDSDNSDDDESDVMIKHW